MDLAYDIAEVIKRLKQKIEGGQKAATAAPVIYLAETSSDQARLLVMPSSVSCRSVAV